MEPGLLARRAGGSWLAGRAPAVAIAGFGVDSRSLKPGQLFVALRSERRDGHDFLAAAIEAGAAAALVSRPKPELGGLPQLVVPDTLKALQALARERRREFPGPVVGVTGSCGKTSTKELLALLLGGPEAGVLATEGNLNNHIGVPLSLLRLDPESHRFAVIEAGISAPGEMETLAGMIEPDLAIVTLVAAAHTRDLGGIEGVAREKALLAAGLRRGGLALVSEGCMAFEAFRNLVVPVRTADGLRITQSAAGTELSLKLGGIRHEFRARCLSDGMAHNAALAIDAAFSLGAGVEQMRRRLDAWRPSPLRGEVLRVGGRLLYLDCYNANPASMHDALVNFARLSPGEEPRLYLLGCMEELGEAAPRHHREIGRSVRLRPADQVRVVGGEAASLAAGLAEAGAMPGQVSEAAGAAELAGLAAKWPGPVFVKGSRRYRMEESLSQIELPGGPGGRGAHAPS